MSLKDTLTEDLTEAIKAKREPDRTLLRSLMAALHNQEISGGGELDDAQVLKVLSKQLKLRDESVAAAKDRPEMAAREQAEADLIKAYLPQPLSEAELAGLVIAAIKETGAAGPADMGKVMGAVGAKAAGRADGAALAALVKAQLSKSE